MFLGIKENSKLPVLLILLLLETPAYFFRFLKNMNRNPAGQAFHF